MLSMITEDDKISSYLNNTPLSLQTTGTEKMNKLCRRVSIESPSIRIQDCVFNFEVPVPEVPPNGARIQVVCAGACYRMRPRSASASSLTSTQSTEEVPFPNINPPHHGLRDSALFPGFEVAGVIDAFGEDVEDTDLKIGQRVIIYPYDDLPHGYTEYMIVPDLSYLVPIPDELSLSLASMLPTGALLAKSAVITAENYVKAVLEGHPKNHICKILIVGTGGLALWAIRIAEHQFKRPNERVKVTVASLRDEGFKLASEIPHITLVQWNEDLYEKQLIERTKDACNGPVDIVIDFGTTSRSLHRSLQCLNAGGVVLVSEEVAERLLPKFSRLIAEKNQRIEAVTCGSIDLLKTLVESVARKEVTPPPYTEFAAEDAPTVVQKLSNSEIAGRAVLRFHDIE